MQVVGAHSRLATVPGQWVEGNRSVARAERGTLADPTASPRRTFRQVGRLKRIGSRWSEGVGLGGCELAIRHAASPWSPAGPGGRLVVRLLPELRARQVLLELERQPLMVRLLLAPGVRHQHQGAARAIRNDPGGPHARRADRPDCVTREPHPQHGWLQQLERRLPPGFALMSDIAVRHTAPPISGHQPAATG